VTERKLDELHEQYREDVDEAERTVILDCARMARRERGVQDGMNEKMWEIEEDRPALSQAQLCYT
jgi:hypothetical protein